MKGKVFLIPTVIAEGTENKVISDEIKEIISMLDFFMVENIRSARRFISRLKLGKVIDDITFLVIDKNTNHQQMPGYFSEIEKGRDVGIISESGCPGIADPGAVAVAWAHKQGVQVVPLSGPSSILMALMASGFNGQSFTFHGYVPIDKKAKENKILQMEKDALQKSQTQLFMDTPYRNQALFTDIVRICHSETLLCVAKGITGEQEFIQTKKIAEWKKTDVDLHKVPTIFAVYVER